MKSIKKNIYIIGAFAFLIIALAVSGTIVYLNRNVQNSDSTAIGHIYLGNMTDAERRDAIQDGINEWEKNLKSGGGYTITYQNMTMHFFITDYIYYNADLTMKNLEVGSPDNRAFLLPKETNAGAEFSLQKLEAKIKEYFFADYGIQDRAQLNFGNYESGKKGELCYDMLDVAGQFYSNYEFDLYDYLAPFSDEKVKELSTITLDTTGYESNVRNIVKQLTDTGLIYHERANISGGMDKTEYTGIKVVNGETDKDGFSLLQYTEEKKMDLSARDLSILGTGMTALAMDSNFTNIRRNSDREMPSYSYYNRASSITIDGVAGEDTYGIATRISRPNNEDLTFYNSDSFDYNIRITANESGSEIYFTLIGPRSTKRYTITAEITTKNYNITPPVNEGTVTCINSTELATRAAAYVALGYIDYSTNGQFLTENGIFLNEGQMLLYFQKDGRNGAEVSYYRTYNKISDKEVKDKNGVVIGYTTDITQVKDEKIFKDAAYPAAAQEGSYVILEVESISEGLL